MKLCFVFLITINLIFSNQGIALITKSKGDVEYQKNDGTIIKNKLLKKGTSLFDQDILSTGANGFAKYVYLDDGSIIKVHKNAEVIVSGAVQNRSIIKQVKVNDGNVKFEVSRQGSNDFTVITPTSVATVKGTDFWLESDEDEGDRFFGLSGLVTVTNLESNIIRQLTRNTTVVSQPDGTIDIKKTDVNDFKKLQRLELSAGEIDQNEFDESILEQQGEDSPEGEIRIQLDDGSGSLKEIIIKYK